MRKINTKEVPKKKDDSYMWLEGMGVLVEK